MDKLIQLLKENARYSVEELASIVGLTAKEVETELSKLIESGTILGFAAVTDISKLEGSNAVSALIEVKLTPARGGGFDRLARRIALFDEVESCMLMSGAYDLCVVISGSSLHSVATFVAENITENGSATINGITMKASSEVCGVITSITLASGQVIAYSL